MDNGYRDDRPEGYLKSSEENEKYDSYLEFEKRERLRREERRIREERIRQEQSSGQRQGEPEEDRYDPYREKKSSTSGPSGKEGEEFSSGEDPIRKDRPEFNPTVIRGGMEDNGSRRRKSGKGDKRGTRRDKKARKRQLKQYNKQERQAARRRRKLDRKQVDKRQIRNRVIAVVTILILLAGALFGLYVFFTSSIFAISEITVKNNALKSDKEIIRESGVTIGQNIFSYKDSEIKNAILKNNPYITDVTISRQLPNRFLITVEEHTPVAAIKYNGKYLILDENGIVAGVEDTQLNATRITGIQVQNYKKGSKPVVQSSSKLKKALKLIGKVNDSGLYFKKLDVSSSLVIRGYITDTLECTGEADDIINNLEGIKAVVYDLSQKNTMNGTISVGKDGYATFSPARAGSASSKNSSGEGGKADSDDGSSGKSSASGSSSSSKSDSSGKSGSSSTSESSGKSDSSGKSGSSSTSESSDKSGSSGKSGSSSTSESSGKSDSSGKSGSSSTSESSDKSDSSSKSGSSSN